MVLQGSYRASWISVPGPVAVSVPLLVIPPVAHLCVPAGHPSGKHSLSTHCELSGVCDTPVNKTGKAACPLSGTQVVMMQEHIPSCHNCSPQAKMPKSWERSVRLTTRGQPTLWACPETSSGSLGAFYRMLAAATAQILEAFAKCGAHSRVSVLIQGSPRRP